MKQNVQLVKYCVKSVSYKKFILEAFKLSLNLNLNNY